MQPSLPLALFVTEGGDSLFCLGDDGSSLGGH